MREPSLKQQTIGGIFWNTFGLIARQGTTFLVSLVLCRLLDVADFGEVALCVGLIGICQALTDAGLVSALIRQKDLTQEQWSTAFWLNLILGASVASIICLGATYIGSFFAESRIGNILVTLAPLTLLHSFFATQQTRLRKELEFKTIAMASLVGALVSGPAGILLAYLGWGMWTLVVQVYLSTLIRGLILWFSSSWRPILVFRLASLSPMWNYIKKVFFVDMLSIISTRIDVLIIGKLFNTVQLGYYHRSKSFNKLINRYTAESLRVVFFSAFASIAEQKMRVRLIYAKLLSISGYAAIGLSGSFYITADEIVPLLFSEKWIPSIPYLKVMLLAGYALPLHSLQTNVMKAVGDGSSLLRGDIIKKLLLCASFVFGFRYGILGFLWARVIVSAIEILVINCIFVKRDIGDSISRQVLTIVQYVMIALVLIVFWESSVEPKLSLNRVVMLLLAGCYFAVTYIFVNFILRTEGQKLLLSELQQRIRQIKGITT